MPEFLDGARLEMLVEKRGFCKSFNPRLTFAGDFPSFTFFAFVLVLFVGGIQIYASNCKFQIRPETSKKR